VAENLRATFAIERSDRNFSWPFRRAIPLALALAVQDIRPAAIQPFILLFHTTISRVLPNTLEEKYIFPDRGKAGSVARGNRRSYRD